jgi:EAL domain-containing protein (putative c-di-GMP-specific phosphodiesterase class I)
LQGLQDLRTRSGDDAVNALLREIAAVLRLNAVDGASAGRLSADKFGVVRAAPAGDGALKPEIERLVRACDPQGKTVQVHESDVQLVTAGLTSADVARALAYTLGRFVSDSEEFSLPTLVDGFRAQIAETVSRMSQIKSVVLAKKIDVAFQPIVHLQGRAIHHYEMLARFEANASPYELINFAEQIGLIEDIDLFICQRGISVLAALRSDKASIAINISARSLGSDMFVQSLIGLCEQRPALRDRLLFEVTESAAIKDLARVGRILTQLRQAGHRICLDDFGAGSSSFPYLQALAVDFVKIDGAYVERMATSRKDRSILVAMVSMCKELEVETIAEKIEHEDQARTLLDLGVGYGQGYLFGRPTVSPAGLAA